MLKSATESKLARILRTLGNKDAIKILRFAKSGFDSTSDAHKKLGLSIKRYYYRLEKLMDAGVITKTNERYELTPLGVVVCDSIERRIVWAIENIDQLQIVETLKKSNRIDDETLRRATEMVFGDESRYPLANIGLIKTYERLAEVTSQLIDGATERVYLATRYTDARCTEAWWRALRRGVEMRAIDGDIGTLSGRMKMLRMVISRPASIKAFYEIWHSDASQIRHRDVPFSFMVVNHKIACLEILNPEMEGFFVAIQFESKEICDKLMRTFHKLWRDTKEDPLKGLSEDLMERIPK